VSNPPIPQFCAYCGAALPAQSNSCAACGRQQLSYAGATATGLLVSNHLLKQRYRVQRRLGQGGFGAVYQAEDTQLQNAMRAVKEMSQSGMSPQELAQATIAFQQEATLLIGLVHPHLPRIYDSFEEAGRWYLVMDFIAGETLEDRLGQAPGGRLPLEEVLEIGLQLTAVLGYLHTRQPPIIFRDLKPANVMLTPENDLYLIDFGIARLFKPGQAKDTVAFGSPGYAAPEQWGKTQTTAQSDIYSLGALLHQLLSGVDPSTNQPLLWDFTPLSAAIPASLITLVMNMVKERMSERPASMAVIRQELQRIAGQQTHGSGASAPASLAPSLVLPPAAASPQKTKEQWLDEGYDHEQAGRYTAALAAYERAAQLDPSYMYAWNNIGNALNVLRRPQEGLAAYERALQLDPTYARAWAGKGYALNELKRYAEGLAAYECAIQFDPSYAVAWNGKGWALVELNRYTEALAACERALQLDPANAHAWNNKGNALNALKRNQEAQAAYERALQLDPTFVFAWNNTGKVLNELKRHEEGLAAYERALQLDPNYAIAWNGKGWALIETKRYAEGLAACERAIQLDPGNMYAWNNKGRALNNLQRFQESLAAYERALQLDPTYANAWHNKGNVLNELKRYPEGLAAYECAIQFDPHLARAWNGKGRMLNELKRYQEALAACKRAIQLDPAYALAYVYKGDALQALRRKKEAEHAYQKARALGWQG
jgi:tetratricopeptide (TPR) repeat protein/predicted Ser/Thr protein kinase